MRTKHVITGACFTGLFLTGAANGLAEDQPKGWVSSAAAGLTLTTGNSESVMATAKMDSAKKWDQHEISLGADASYGTTTDPDTDVKSTTAASAHAFGQYNHLFTERLYGYGRADVLHDDVADVAYRLTLSPGVGYYFIKETKMDLSGEVGPGFIYEKTGSGADEDTRGYFTIRLADKFHYKISEHARIWQTAELLPQIDDFDNYLINLEAGIEADLTDKASLRSFILDNFDNDPSPGREKNDLKWITAIAYKF